jgi:hypothetical protein
LILARYDFRHLAPGFAAPRSGHGKKRKNWPTSWAVIEKGGKKQSREPGAREHARSATVRGPRVGGQGASVSTASLQRGRRRRQGTWEKRVFFRSISISLDRRKVTALRHVKRPMDESKRPCKRGRERENTLFVALDWALNLMIDEREVDEKRRRKEGEEEKSVPSCFHVADRTSGLPLPLRT